MGSNANPKRLPSTVYLVRHGQSQANQDSMNLPEELDVLTETGRVQAGLLGKHLQDVLFTKVYASSFPRASDTAKEILANLNGNEKPKLEIDERIREREFGHYYENRPMGDLFNDLFAATRNGTKALDFEVPGGETVAELNKRMDAFLEELFEFIRNNEQPQTILIVTHGVFIMRIMLKLQAWAQDPTHALTLNGWNLKEVTIPISNTAYHLFTVDTTKDEQQSIVIDILKMHESGHLNEYKASLPPKKPDKEIEEITKKWVEVVNTQCVTQ